MLDIPAIAYFKGKNTWCGSHKNTRCRIAPSEDGLSVTTWPEPWSFEKTEDDKKLVKSFPFSSEGLCEIDKYLSEIMK